MSNGNLTKCWRGKGYTGNIWPARPWSEVVKGKTIITVWNNRRDPEDSEFKCIGGKDVLRFQSGEWVQYWKGKRYMQHLKDSMTSGVPCEVIMIEGRRWPLPSEVRNAYIDPYRYYAIITDIKPNGIVEGDLLPE
jgi:hypothetical protein